MNQITPPCGVKRHFTPPPLKLVAPQHGDLNLKLVAELSSLLQRISESSAMDDLADIHADISENLSVGDEVGKGTLDRLDDAMRMVDEYQADILRARALASRIPGGFDALLGVERG